MLEHPAQVSLLIKDKATAKTQPRKNPAHSIEYQFSKLIFCNISTHGIPKKIMWRNETVKAMSMANTAQLVFGPIKMKITPKIIAGTIEAIIVAKNIEFFTSEP